MRAGGNGLAEHADALYRAATECCRQHQRYARLVDKRAAEQEQRSALEVAFLSDDALGTAIMNYESATGRGAARTDEAWWRRGNMLWHASREYIRRHANCNGLARRVRETSPDALGHMAMEFDLEASALLALKMAADSYREVRPEAG